MKTPEQDLGIPQVQVTVEAVPVHVRRGGDGAREDETLDDDLEPAVDQEQEGSGCCDYCDGERDAAV